MSNDTNILHEFLRMVQPPDSSSEIAAVRIEYLLEGSNNRQQKARRSPLLIIPWRIATLVKGTDEESVVRQWRGVYILHVTRERIVGW